MWAQFVSMGIGVWLMAAPAVLGHAGPARTNDHVVGPLVFTFACVAVFEATRGVRRVNTALGAWLLLAPLVLGYEGAAWAGDVAAGLALIPLSLVRGAVASQFGGGWAALVR